MTARNRLGLRIGNLAAAFLATAGLDAAAVSLPAVAQDTAATAQVAESAGRREFDIPAQSLTTALARFGQQSGLQVTTDGSLVRGLTTGGVRGRMTSDEALRRMLSGTEITYTVGGNTAVLRRLAQAGELPANAMQLPPVQVEASAGPPSTALIGNLPVPYAGGQVATGGQVGLLGNRDFMDTPFNQTSYTSKLVQDQNARTLDDVVRNDPSVRKASSPGNGIEDFIIRGFEVSGRDFLFNGLPAISPTNGSAMMTESVERIEVLKGPSALLNGIVPENAVGGTINVISKRATAEPVTQFSPDYATESQIGGHVDVGRRYGSDQEFGIRFNGVLRGGDTPINNQSRDQRLTAFGLDYKSERIRLSSDLGYQYDGVNGVRRGLRVNAGLSVPRAPSNKTNYNNPFEYQTTEVHYGTFLGELDITRDITAFATIGGNQLYQDFTTANLRITSANGGIGATTVSNNAYKFSAVSGNTGLRSRFETGPVLHQAVLAYGRSWREWGIDSSSAVNLKASNLYNLTYTTTGPASARYGNARKSQDLSFASYVVGDTLSVLDKRLQLTVGVRQQEVEIRRYNRASGAITSNYKDSALTPMVGVVGKVLPNVSLYANYIEGLQEGGVAPTGAANVGEVLSPHVVEQYEAGVKWDLGRLTTAFSAFQITQPSADTNPVTNIFEVIGEQQNRGVELNVFGEVADGVRALGGITYIDAKLTKTTDGTNIGNRPQAVSPYYLVLGVEWDIPFLRGLTVMGRVTNDGPSYLDTANSLKVPGWTRVDVGARYRFERANGKPIIVRATVNNLADSDYWVSTGSQIGLSEPLTFRLSTSFDF